MMRLISAVSLVGVTACSGTNTERDFLCAAQLGTPCSTIAQADGRGTEATIPVTERAEDTAMESLSQNPLGTGKVNGAFGEMPDGGFGYQSDRYRVPELTGRLWISPYLDDNQILHESRYVHFVILEAHWERR